MANASYMANLPKIEQARQILTRHDVLTAEAKKIKNADVRAITLRAITEQAEAGLRALYPSHIVATTSTAPWTYNLAASNTASA